MPGLYNDPETRAAEKNNEPETEPQLIASASEESLKRRKELNQKAKKETEQLWKEIEDKSEGKTPQISDTETCQSMLKEVLGKPYVYDVEHSADRNQALKDVKQTNPEPTGGQAKNKNKSEGKTPQKADTETCQSMIKEVMEKPYVFYDEPVIDPNQALKDVDKPGANPEPTGGQTDNKKEAQNVSNDKTNGREKSDLKNEPKGKESTGGSKDVNKNNEKK